MERKLVSCFIILIFALSLYLSELFAEEASSVSREELISNTFSFLQEEGSAGREKAIGEAMKVATKKKSREKRISGEEGFAGFSLPQAHPYVDQETAYNDNLDITRPQQGSVINSLTPGVKMNFVGQGKSVNLDVHLNNVFFNQRNKADFQGGEASLLSNFGLGKYNISFFDDYTRNYHIAKTFGTSDFNAHQLTWQNSFTTILGRNFNRAGFNAEYQRVDNRYAPTTTPINSVTESAFSIVNKTEETYSFKPYVRITKKTKALLEYSYDRLNYHNVDSPDNSHYNNLDLTLSSILTPKLTASFKAGYKTLDLKVSPDTNTTTYTTQVGYAPTTRSDINFSFKYAHVDSPDSASRYAEEDFVLSANHRLASNPKFNFSAKGEIDHYIFPKLTTWPTRKNNTNYTLELGLTYAFRQWLDFSLGWTYKNVKSNIDIEYDNNIIAFKTQAKF